MLWKWGYSSANRAQIFKARHRTDRHCHCDSLNLPSKSVSERKARTKRRVTKSIRGQSYNYFKIQRLALKPPKTEHLNWDFLRFRNRKWGSARVRPRRAQDCNSQEGSYDENSKTNSMEWLARAIWAKLAHRKSMWKFREVIALLKSTKSTREVTERNTCCWKYWGHPGICRSLHMKVIAGRKLPMVSW